MRGLAFWKDEDGGAYIHPQIHPSMQPSICHIVTNGPCVRCDNRIPTLAGYCWQCADDAGYVDILMRWDELNPPPEKPYAPTVGELAALVRSLLEDLGSEGLEPVNESNRQIVNWCYDNFR